jgi:hypothetical protein
MTATPPVGVRERVDPGGTVAGRPRNAASLLSGVLRRWPLVVVLLVTAGFTAVCLREAWLDAPTLDEPVYVAAGVLGEVHHDLTFNEEHPPFPKVIAALPVLADRPSIPRGWSKVSGHQETQYAARFTDAQAASGKLRTVTFLSRLMPILEAIAVGLVLYRLGALLYGAAAGAIAGVLWLANPLTMGLGHIDGVDIPMALATALTSLALLRWQRRRDRGSVVLVGAAAGAAGAAGLDGLLVIAVAAGVVMAAGWRGQGWRGQAWRALAVGLAVTLTAAAVIWVSYVVLDPRVILHPALGLPQPYVDGLRYLKAHDSNGYGYLLGVQWLGHRWWFWPGSLLVKTPLPTLVILVIGSLALLAVPRRARREVLLVIALPALALMAFTLFVPPDTGVRYLLPAVALLLVVASGAVVIARGYTGRAALAALVSVSVVMAVTSFPHSIAWTTPPFTPGYQYASGTSLDWGQDSYLVQRWSQGRHPYTDLHGVPSLTPQGARRLLGADPREITGWVAVSATLLTGRGNSLPAWLRSYCPVSTIGGSILIYRFGRPPSSAAPGPPHPAGLCQDSRYSHLVAASGLCVGPVGRGSGRHGLAAARHGLGHRRREPDPAAVGPEPEQCAEPDPEDQRDVVRQLAVHAQHVVREADAGQLDPQPDGVQAEEHHVLTGHRAAFAVPEGPVTVPDEGHAGARDGGDHVGGERSHPGPEVEQVRADGGGQEGDGADHAELGHLVGQLPEPLVQSADHSHQAPTPSHVPRTAVIVTPDSTPRRGRG